jgi:hypothetical protein
VDALHGDRLVGHLGVNVLAGKNAPAFAYSTNMTDDQCNLFMNKVIQVFYQTAQDVFVATTKTI